MPISQARISTKTKGFTLLELLVVVLLISIFVTFASVNWGVFAKKDSETLLEKFSLEVGLLREEAISGYQEKAIRFDLANNTVSMGAVNAVDGFRESRRLDLPDGYVLKDVVVNGVKTIRGTKTMSFYPSALVDKAIIHFETRTQYYTLIIQPLTAKVEAQDAYVEEISLTDRVVTP
jgi:prepilin-type N-terminal cleavage/methylation domain-containing protein